ncbi:MAG: SCO family protein, partial [Deltaproteobacteria bacterium]
MVSRLRALRLAAVLGATLSASAAFSQPALPPNETGTIGRRIADARLVDANGDELRVRSLAGKPLIVSPIFTRCRHVCPRITANLKSAIAGLGAPGEDFNVLSVTFDAGDT